MKVHCIIIVSKPINTNEVGIILGSNGKDEHKNLSKFDKESKG